MRVALFFDGKNHMKDLRRAAPDRWLDHGALARWIVEHVGGTRLAGAYYYTGVPNPEEDASDRHALSDLLDELERRPGFFVRRFNRRAATRDCPHCKQLITYTEEKMVDTSLVADAILFAVRDAFDIAVIFSGDLDVAPAMTAIHAFGKQAWIATFGDQGLSRTLVRSAWDNVDLVEHLDAFTFADLAETPPKRVPDSPELVDAEMRRELLRAEAHFGAGGGFVGAHYFIHRWKGHAIPDSPEERRQSLQRLMGARLAETYTVDGKTAVRAIGGVRSGESAPPLPAEDDETTMEFKVPVTLPPPPTPARDEATADITVVLSPRGGDTDNQRHPRTTGVRSSPSVIRRRAATPDEE